MTVPDRVEAERRTPYRVKQRFMWIEALAKRGRQADHIGDPDVALVEIRDAAREAYADWPEVAEARLEVTPTPDTEALERVRDAWLDGFLASGEGWNGEYPFDEDRDDPRLQERADEYVSSLPTKEGP